MLARFTILQNAAQVYTFLGGLGFAVGVVIGALRLQGGAAREVPWWWWIGSGSSLILLGLGNHFSVLQGVLLVAGAFQLGIGAVMFVLGYRAGRIRFRRASVGPSAFDIVANDDWRLGAQLVDVLDVVAMFGLDEDNPYIDIWMSVMSVSLHKATLQGEVRGRINVPDREHTFKDLAHPPELRQVTVGTTTYPASSVELVRNQSVRLMLRQHLLPPVRDLLVSRAGTEVTFSFQRVDVGVVFRRANAEGQIETKDRERLLLTEYRFMIPEVAR